MSLSDIISEIKKYDCKLVEVTGGEPLIQSECLDLMSQLCDQGYDVMIETGGSLTVKEIDSRVKIIMDLKTPSSGMMKKNLWENLNHLKEDDEIKFVIGSRDDYEWAKEKVKKYEFDQKHIVLFSSVFGKIDHKELVDWILKDKLKVRYQLQMHKYIWDPDKRGV